MSNQIQENNQRATLAQTLAKPDVNEYINNLLKEKTSQFVGDLTALQESSPKLRECNQMQLIKCAVTATALNLPLNKNLGFAHVIPYEKKSYNNQTRKWEVASVEAQFQMGYKGFIQLAMRTGQYKTINVCDVRDGEMKRNKFTGEVDFIGEFPDNEIVGYMAYFKMLNGMEQSVYMSSVEMLNHADKYSQAFSRESYEKMIAGTYPEKELYKLSSPWYKSFDVMAKKTVIKQLLSKWGVLSTELSLAITTDQSNGKDYVDNPNYEFNEVTPEEIQAPKIGVIETSKEEEINQDIDNENYHNDQPVGF